MTQRSPGNAPGRWFKVLAVCFLAALAAAPLGALAAPATPAPEPAAAGCEDWQEQLHETQPFNAPAEDRSARIKRDGQSVLPNGRIITPAGTNVSVAPHPYGLATSPDGKTLVTANSGTSPFSVSVLGLGGKSPAVRQIPPGARTDPAVLNAVFMGLVIAPDNRALYVSGGNDGLIAAFDLQSGARTATIDLNVPAGGRSWKDSYIGDLKLSPDGKTLWAVDQANFRIVGVDLATQTVTKVAGTGRYPFGLTITPDGSTAYVANVGMYQYSFVAGFDPNNPMDTGLKFPPFADRSPEARDGAVVEGKNVPGLGDPNAPESFSVWAINLASGDAKAKLKTGPLVGQLVNGIPAVGGSAPNSVVTDGKRVYVSNNSSDTVAVIDIATNQVVDQIALRLPDPRLATLRGIMPFGLALSPNGRTLYVAESGINAVAVIDTASRAVLGHIPVGWFPSKLAVSPDGGSLYVANAKGYGSGPNGGAGFTPGPEGTYIGNIQKGTVSLIGLPDFASERGKSRLAQWTTRVIKNNGFVAHATKGAATGACAIKHVVFITKENRTYDEVFGDLGAMANRTVNGDPTLARYGQAVTPNHHALAHRFAHSDNFYVDSDVSADGHRWLVGVAPNAFVETSWAATYGGRRDFRYEPDTAPGRLGFTESNSALAPEDYPEAGSIWEHLYRNKVEFRNYGEGFEFAGIFEDEGSEPTGARLPVNVPMPAPLFARTARDFPTYNTRIPDQYRVDQFERDFTSRYLAGGEEMPPFVNVYLPNDHTAGPRPAAGYPTRASYVADNDIALGRVVELISHSKYWASTAIFVTEDDAQDGVDHVDAHRSLLLVISPWARRNYVSSDHTSIPSIIKTINLLTGAPSLNLYDAPRATCSTASPTAPTSRPTPLFPPTPRSSTRAR